MQITYFKLSTDKTKIDLTITDAADVVSLSVWTDKTYKEFSKLIDLSGKLTGAATENIEIFPSDLGLSFFDGIYFIEAEDDTEASLEFTYELSKYKECILTKAINATTCKESLEKSNTTLLNIYTLYKSLEYSIDLRFINEMLLIIDSLNKYCIDPCTTCSGNTESINDYENSNPDTIEIIVDGGDATTNFD